MRIANVCRRLFATSHPCPILFIAGADDRQVSPETVVRARDAFARSGHPTRYLLLPGLGHRWATEFDINRKIWSFLEPNRLEP